MTNSISFRFNLITTAIVLVLLAAFGAYNHGVTQKALNNQLARQVDGVTKRLQQNLPPTLWNFESGQLTRIVESEVVGAGIGTIIVQDDKGQLVIGRMADAEGGVSETRTLPDTKATPTEAGLVYDDGTPRSVGRLIVYPDDSTIRALQRSALIRQVVQTLVLLVILVAAVNFLVRTLVVRPIRDVHRALTDIAQGEGDLTQRLTARRNDEIGQLAGTFNEFVGKIQSLVREVVQAVEHMGSAISQMQEIAARTSTGVNRQRAETDQVATAMGEMSSTAHDVAKSAQQASVAAQDADAHSHSAQQIVGESIKAIRSLASEIEHGADVINDLEKVVTDITSVLAVIRGIAEQTNLLALNAAIEAARAGEQGRGFAVVADEVRNLASKTQSSTEEIQHMIQRLQDGTRKAVDVMQDSKANGERTVAQANQADSALQGVVAAISTINEM
ncbi:MAG: methyl-accepting chemotaxis protein, partial [Gammaproteobacteria bacterium]|nr:methyl-accepting chemotaxis protein [Gammaproteobacteria bacterium]